jgi:predicted 2-oxoglutarate/Fe(II)-dependent dioxygenase YbiX
MREHEDHIQSLFLPAERRGVPILSLVGYLNDDHEGGEFYLRHEDVKAQAGEMLVFPSNFLFPHEVKPVTSGTRYSFVSWAW